MLQPSGDVDEKFEELVELFSSCSEDFHPQRDETQETFCINYGS